MQAVYDASAWVLPVLFAITFHEAAHGFTAWLFGDNTAKLAGRMSLNPIRHIDRFGTIALPAILLLIRSPVLFGYAKPVPVNFDGLYPPRVGAAIVAAAGPATNIVLAIASALLLAVPWGNAWVFTMLRHSITLNATLAVFNLLPILPLDGGRILAAFLPRVLERPFRRLESYGMVIVFALIGFAVLTGFDLLGGTLVVATDAVVTQIMRLAHTLT